MGREIERRQDKEEREAIGENQKVRCNRKKTSKKERKKEWADTTKTRNRKVRRTITKEIRNSGVFSARLSSWCDAGWTDH